MGMVMVKRNWTSDCKVAEEAFSAINEHARPIWLISYLEGSRATPQKIEEVSPPTTVLLFVRRRTVIFTGP